MKLFEMCLMKIKRAQNLKRSMDSLKSKTKIAEILIRLI